MKRIIWFNMVTLDGFFEGLQGEIDWHHVDEEFNSFASKQLDSLDMLLFGRVTYEMMASYWPTENAISDDPIIAEKMNTKPKIVYSTTLAKANWSNTHLVNENAIKETFRLKQKEGLDMAIFGSATLANSFLEAGLVDEIRAMVNPLLLGTGHPMFKNGLEKKDLKLISTRVFDNGNVLLTYQPLPGKPA
jgi:dihydrofolate reductase